MEDHFAEDAAGAAAAAAGARGARGLAAPPPSRLSLLRRFSSVCFDDWSAAPAAPAGARGAATLFSAYAAAAFRRAQSWPMADLAAYPAAGAASDSEVHLAAARSSGRADGALSPLAAAADAAVAAAAAQAEQWAGADVEEIVWKVRAALPLLVFLIFF